jgi:hypothetical protein
MSPKLFQTSQNSPSKWLDTCEDGVKYGKLQIHMEQTRVLPQKEAQLLSDEHK